MWIVVRDWGLEASVEVFYDEKEALDFFDEWIGVTDAEMYLAKVDKTLNV